MTNQFMCTSYLDEVAVDFFYQVSFRRKLFVITSVRSRTTYIRAPNQTKLGALNGIEVIKCSFFQLSFWPYYVLNQISTFTTLRKLKWSNAEKMKMKENVPWQRCSEGA